MNSVDPAAAASSSPSDSSPGGSDSAISAPRSSYRLASAVCRTAMNATKYRTNEAPSLTTSATMISPVSGSIVVSGDERRRCRHRARAVPGQEQQHHPLVVRPRPHGVGQHREVHGDGGQARPGDDVRPVEPVDGARRGHRGGGECSLAARSSSGAAAGAPSCTLDELVDLLPLVVSAARRRSSRRGRRRRPACAAAGCLATP